MLFAVCIVRLYPLKISDVILQFENSLKYIHGAFGEFNKLHMKLLQVYVNLSYDVASGSDMTPCNNFDKTLAVTT